jgi:hypothetical protein
MKTPTPSDELLCKFKTSEGFYVETLLVLVASLYETCYIDFTHKGFKLHNGASPSHKIMLEASLKHFDTARIDPSLVGKSKVLNCERMGAKLSTIKKKDVATISIKKSSPNVLLLTIWDTSKMMKTPIEISMVDHISQDLGPRMPVLKELDHVILIDSADVTKSNKLVNKQTAKFLVIESHPKGIRYMSRRVEDSESVLLFELGKWKKPVLPNRDLLDASSYTMISKVYTLGKKMKLYAGGPIPYGLSTSIGCGLGKISIAFDKIASAV